MTITRVVELRADAEATSFGGVVLTYGDVARIWGQSERFEAGSISWGDTVICNLQHDRSKPIARLGAGLVLSDTDTRLTAEVTPVGPFGGRALEFVRTKLLRGLSIEFKPTKERVDGATRVIEAARMRGVALVDIPAYPKSLVRCCATLGEVRQQGPVGVQGEIDFGGEGAVISQQHRRRLIIEPGAVSAADDVVLLRGYSYDQPLASSAAGSLRVTVDEDGLRFVASRLADTAIARETKTLMRSGLLNSVVAGLQRGDKPGDTEIVQDGSWRNEIIRANAMLCELNLLTSRTAGGGVRSAGRGRRWLQYA